MSLQQPILSPLVVMTPHWKAPTIIAGSLLTAFCLALGHHLYYKSLAGQEVITENTLTFGKWSGLSSQKLHTAVGTTFASFFRTSLVVAVTLSYTQILWINLKSTDTNIAVMDAIVGARGNPLASLDIVAWKKHRILLCCALIAWYNLSRQHAWH